MSDLRPIAVEIRRAWRAGVEERSRVGVRDRDDYLDIPNVLTNVYFGQQLGGTGGVQPKLLQPALVVSPQGDIEAEAFPDRRIGRSGSVYLLDFRGRNDPGTFDSSYERIHALAEAVRVAMGPPAVLWEYQPPEFGIDIAVANGLDPKLPRIVALVQFDHSVAVNDPRPPAEAEA